MAKLKLERINGYTRISYGKSYAYLRNDWSQLLREPGCCDFQVMRLTFDTMDFMGVFDVDVAFLGFGASISVWYSEKKYKRYLRECRKNPPRVLTKGVK